MLQTGPMENIKVAGTVHVFGVHHASGKVQEVVANPPVNRSATIEGRNNEMNQLWETPFVPQAPTCSNTTTLTAQLVLPPSRLKLSRIAAFGDKVCVDVIGKS